MAQIFAKKCASCGMENQRDAVFCRGCGHPFANKGERVCGACGTENRVDSVFCKNCGRPLGAHEEAELQENRWSRREGDFAMRLDIRDLPGVFRKQLEIEPGTRALVYANGVPQEVLPPGTYTLKSIGESVGNWINGVPDAATVLLVDAIPPELIISIEKRYTSDPLPISLDMRLVIEVEDVPKFLLNALHSRGRYSIDDLREYVQPELAAVVDRYLRERTLEQLVNNPATKEELELAVEEELRTSFKHYGLKLVSMRTLALDLEAYDKIKDITGKYSLLIAEGEADVGGKERLLALQKKVNLQDLAEETGKVENEERKIDLYQRMRTAALSDKMNEVRSEADFTKFMDEVDYEKLLSEKERNDLLQGWKEEAEDHTRARAFLLAKADVEEKYLLEAVKVKSQGELDLKEQEFRLEMERQRAGLNIKIEEEKWQSELRRRETEAQMDVQDAEQGIDLLMKLKKGKQELEENALKMRLDEARANVEIEITRLEAEHKLEMERLDKLATLGTEALIAASPAEQAQIIQDLKKTEILKDMSDDQILAMAAAKSPEIAQVFGEKFRAIAEGEAGEKQKELYERLIAENKANQQLLLDAQKDAMERLQHMSEHDVDAIMQISKSYAQQSSPQVVVAGAGGRIVRSTAAGIDGEELKGCPNCGRQVPVDSRFCPFCNNEFADLKQ